MNHQVLTAFVAVALATTLSAAEPEELQTARERFQSSSPRPSETDRQRYIVGLAALRAKFAEARRTDDWKAVDAEIRRHPAPKDSDSVALSKTLVGEWASPRHEYVFRSDGAWSMLPAEPGTTHGRWRIEGNQYFDTVALEPPATRQYTIILLTPQDFIFTDGEVVFYETRIKK